MTNKNIIDDLILNGAVEVAGVDPETGELLYNFTDKLKQIAPDIYKLVIEEFKRDILFFWEYGFIDMDVTIENPVVTINQKALDPAHTEWLTKEQKVKLEDLINKIINE